MNQDSQHWVRLAPILICAVVAVAHGASIWGGFVWDDSYTVRDNPQIRALSNTPGYFTESWGAGAPEGSHAHQKNRGLYRPLTLFSFALNHALAGLSTTAFHFTDFLIHLASSILLFFVARNLFSPVFAAIVAIIWSVHPVNTEAIAVLSYRTTLLAGLFSLGALWFQTWENKDREKGRAMGRTLLFGCACLCKEDAIVLAAILPLHDLWVRNLGLKRSTLRAMPLAAVALAYLTIRSLIVTASPFSFFGDISGVEQVAALLQILWLYAKLLLLPFPLNPFYDWQSLGLSRSLVSFNALAGGVILLLILGTVTRWRKAPKAAFLAASILISLAPYSHMVPFTVGAAERFLYMPGIFTLSLFGLVAHNALQREQLTPFLERLGMAMVTAWVVLAMTWSSVRHIQWHSNRSILTVTTRLFPESFNGWKALGDTCRNEGALEEAVRHYATAQETAHYPIAAYLEASTLLDLGRVAEARMRLDDFIQKNPHIKTVDPQGMKMLSDLVDDLNQRLRR